MGYFSDEGSHEYRVYRETAALLSDGCDFFSNIRYTQHVHIRTFIHIFYVYCMYHFQIFYIGCDCM